MLSGADKKKVVDMREDHKKYFFTIFAIPTFAFWLTIVLYNRVYFYYSNYVLAFSALGFFITLAQASTGFGPKLSPTEPGGYAKPYRFPLNFLLCLAFGFGTFAGMYSYDTYSYLTFLYGNSRVYQDALPSAQAASYADAGRFSFASEVKVDQEKTVGYFAPDGHNYCIAPIKDLADVSTYEFWAVGYDCCSGATSGESGDTFQCDGASDPNARGGVVVFDTPGWFGASNKDKYDMARRKAEASFDLVSSPHPLYVRWVKTENINKVETWYRNRAWYFSFGVTSFFAVLVAGFSFFFKRAFYDRK